MSSMNDGGEVVLTDIYPVDAFVDFIRLPYAIVDGLRLRIPLGNAQPVSALEEALGVHFECDVNEYGAPITTFGRRSALAGIMKVYENRWSTMPDCAIAEIDMGETEARVQLTVPVGARNAGSKAVQQSLIYAPKPSPASRSNRITRKLSRTSLSAKASIIENPFWAPSEVRVDPTERGGGTTYVNRIFHGRLGTA